VPVVSEQGSDPGGEDFGVSEGLQVAMEAQLALQEVRNDEVVGLSPTSSTIFSIAYGYALDESCPILSQKSKTFLRLFSLGLATTRLDSLARQWPEAGG
jgi:hypothetical protein